MANYITNDKGYTVVAIGAPASIARAKVEFPLRIEALNELYTQGAKRQRAIDLLKKSGINSELERNSILYHTMFAETKALKQNHQEIKE